jgi:DNA sulfur modification protein DndE
MKIFESIGTSEGLQPYALAKIAMALSIRAGDLCPADFCSNTEGLELNRQTIFGEYETLFKVLLTMENKSPLPDEEFFPILAKAHLDRGAELLRNEVRYGMKFYKNLLTIDNNL